MNKLYAFWEYDIPPYLLGGEVIELCTDGYVEISGLEGCKFEAIKIVPFDIGIALHKKLNEAKREYDESVKAANEKLKSIVKEFYE